MFRNGETIRTQNESDLFVVKDFQHKVSVICSFHTQLTEI